MARVRRCPRDGTETHEELACGPQGRGRVRLDICPRCGGAWFDRGEVARVSGDRQVEQLIVAYAAGPTGLACPRCGREMAARPVGDLTLDVCRTCKGVWVDAGELENAARMLGGEFSDVTSSGEIGSQLGEFPGATRSAMIARVAFAGFATPTLRYLSKPKITRRYPRDRI